MVADQESQVGDGPARLHRPAAEYTWLYQDLASLNLSFSLPAARHGQGKPCYPGPAGVMLHSIELAFQSGFRMFQKTTGGRGIPSLYL
jgi:hypothetical protein